jgi:hypothetical protein
MAGVRFFSTKESLQQLLLDVRSGVIQLPDFQRGWVWDDDRIRSLLASVSLSFPIGAVLLLRAGGAEVRFRPRPVEGAAPEAGAVPDFLILDGQQRLTSLLVALLSDHSVLTRDARGRRMECRYAVHVERVLSAGMDREQAILAVGRTSANGAPRADRDDCLFPLRAIFDAERTLEWSLAYIGQPPDGERSAVWKRFSREFLHPFLQYQVPLILLGQETTRPEACEIFERVNQRGVPLTVFELVTASFAAEDFNLRQDWAARKRRLARERLLGGLEPTDLLEAVALLASLDRRKEDPAAPVSCHRGDLLHLQPAAYGRWADLAADGFTAAARLLTGQGIYVPRELPYRAQLVPLAAILATLGGRAEEPAVQDRIVRWFWSGVFGELYGAAVQSRFERDLPEVLRWIEGGPEPTTVAEASFVPARLRTLRNRASAAYKGAAALLMRDGSLDLINGQPIDATLYVHEEVAVHHVFPPEWCSERSIDESRSECIVNRTPLSARAHRVIGANPPSVYLSEIEQLAELTPDVMDAILASHAIDPSTLRRDDFDAFFALRERELLRRIEAAMGKPAWADALDQAWSDGAEDEES